MELPELSDEVVRLRAFVAGDAPVLELARSVGGGATAA
jgi:hypothetical protein